MHDTTGQSRGMKRNLSLLTSEVAQARLNTAIRWAERELRYARAAERQLSSLISRLRLVEGDQPPENDLPVRRKRIEENRPHVSLIPRRSLCPKVRQTIAP